MPQDYIKANRESKLRQNFRLDNIERPEMEQHMIILWLMLSRE